MARYAIKIGEIHVVSDKPITDEERSRAVQDFMKFSLVAEKTSTAAGVAISIKVPG